MGCAVCDEAVRATIREGNTPQIIDGAFIPPWDRAPRAGIFVSGKPSYVGKFDSVELRYERP